MKEILIFFSYNPIALTMKLIEQRFKLTLSQVDEKGFYERYILRGWAKKIRRLYQEVDFIPQRNPANLREDVIMTPENIPLSSNP